MKEIAYDVALKVKDLWVRASLPITCVYVDLKRETELSGLGSRNAL